MIAGNAGKPHLGERGILFIELSDGAKRFLSIRDKPEQIIANQKRKERIDTDSFLKPEARYVCSGFLRSKGFFHLGR